MKSNQLYQTLDRERLSKAKQSFATRRVATDDMVQLKAGDWEPAAGDLLLAQVESLGHHPRLELTTGRRASMFPGDEIIVCCGSRYAPDQFEAELQNGHWPTDLVAAGGIASNQLSRNRRAKAATKIVPLGAICDSEGAPLNVSDFALKTVEQRLPIKVILVVGTSMSAGKTASAAALVRGLSQQGIRVGAAKVTGTGAGRDPWLMIDSGAHSVLDFTDAGYPSTYKVPTAELESIAHNLIDHLAHDGCDVAVLEVADGLLQPETAALLAAKSFRLRVFGALFTAYDAMGAVTGIRWLQEKGYRMLGMGGRMTIAPLAVREAKIATGLPVYGLDLLSDGPTAEALVRSADVQHRAS